MYSQEFSTLNWGGPPACTASSEPRPAPPRPCLATENAAASSPENALRSEKANLSAWSSPAPFVFARLVLVQQAAQFVNFFARSFAPAQGMHHELAGGAVEDALQHVPGTLALGLLRRQAFVIDLRP